MIFKSRFSSMGNWNFTTKLEFTQYIIWPKFPHVSFHHYFFIYWPNMDSFKTQLNNQTTLNNSPPKTEEIFVRYFWSSASKGISVYKPHVAFVVIQEIWKNSNISIHAVYTYTLREHPKRMSDFWVGRYVKENQT